MCCFETPKPKVNAEERRKKNKRPLFFLSLGSLVKNWSREFNKWLGTQKLNVYMVGTQNQNERRAEDYHKFTSVCPVLIVSYEMFNRTAQSLKVWGKYPALSRGRSFCLKMWGRRRMMMKRSMKKPAKSEGGTKLS